MQRESIPRILLLTFTSTFTFTLTFEERLPLSNCASPSYTALCPPPPSLSQLLITKEILAQLIAPPSISPGQAQGPDAVRVLQAADAALRRCRGEARSRGRCRKRGAGKAGLAPRLGGLLRQPLAGVDAAAGARAVLLQPHRDRPARRASPGQRGRRRRRGQP